MSGSSDGLRPAVCEVCGSSAAPSVMRYCCNYGETHQVACHTYCQPGLNVAGKAVRDFMCLACLDYSRSMSAAWDRLIGQKRPADAEEMPELQHHPSPARARRAHEVKAHLTEQQRIDQAAAEAAAAAAAGTQQQRPSREGPAAAGEQGASKRRRLMTEQQQGQRPARAAAHNAAQNGATRQQAARAGAGQEGGAAAARGRKPHGNTNIIKALNQGHVGEVRRAQDKAKAGRAAAAAAAAAAGGAAAGAERLGGGRGLNKQAAAAAGGADFTSISEGAPNTCPQSGMSDEQQLGSPGQQLQHLSPGGQQQRQQRQRPPVLGLRVSIPDYEGKLLSLELHCRLVLRPDHREDNAQLAAQPLNSQEEADYLHIRGTFWRSAELEATADAAQQDALRQLLQDMAAEDEGQPGQLVLSGGAFDLEDHPTIQRFMDDEALSYRPLLCVPHSPRSEERHANTNIIKEKLGLPRRFLVMSVASALLVLLPTTSGQLVALCARGQPHVEELTREVVATIMADPKLACPSSPRRLGSESLEGPPDDIQDAAEGQQQEEDEDKDALLQLLPAPPPPQPQQEQEQQQAQPEVPPADSAAMAQASGVVGQRPAAQKSVSTADAAAKLRTASVSPPNHTAHDGAAAAAATATTAATPAAAAAATAGGADVTTPAARAASGAAGDAAAAAVGGGGAAAGGSGMSAAAAVQSCPLAQLLLQHGLTDPHFGDEQQQQQQQQQQGKRVLALHNFMPQLPDLSDVQHLRLFLVGFPPEASEEGGWLHDLCKAARKLVDGVYTHDAMQALLRDLHLSSTHSIQQPPGSTATHPVAGDAAQAAAAGGGAAAAAVPLAAAANGDLEQCDLTEGPQDSCYCVLLIPEYYASRQLQQHLGRVPLWQLLASPVAVFRQGPVGGLLAQLKQLAQQQQQQRRLLEPPKDAVAAGAAAAAAAAPGNNSGGRLRLRPSGLLADQVYSDRLAVLASLTTLQQLSADDLEQLLLLLAQVQKLPTAQQQQQQQQHGDGVAGAQVAGCSCVLMLAKEHMETLSEPQADILLSARREDRVVFVEDVLEPGSLQPLDDPSWVISAAAALTLQQQQHLRHIAVIVPDIVDSSGRMPVSPSVSTGGTAAASGQPKSSRSNSGRGEAMPEGVAAMVRSLTKSFVKEVLTGAAQHPQLLAGTFSQMLGLLTGLLDNRRRQEKEQ